jgi:hypothetical protein
MTLTETPNYVYVTAQVTTAEAEALLLDKSLFEWEILEHNGSVLARRTLPEAASVIAQEMTAFGDGWLMASKEQIPA